METIEDIVREMRMQGGDDGYHKRYADREAKRIYNESKDTTEQVTCPKCAWVLYTVFNESEVK